MKAKISSDVGDLLAGPSELDALRVLLADLHGDLDGKVGRFRYLSDISSALGAGGTLLFGGSIAAAALAEARSSFVHGNFIAVILLCQSLAENTLAGYLRAKGGDLPPRITFKDTLSRSDFLSGQDISDLSRLADMRNPLSHFRAVSDPDSLLRRSISEDSAPDDILGTDAHFALALVIRLLAKRPFRVG